VPQGVGVRVPSSALNYRTALTVRQLADVERFFKPKEKLLK